MQKSADELPWCILFYSFHLQTCALKDGLNKNRLSTMSISAENLSYHCRQHQYTLYSNILLTTEW